jgi:hypothetical protein
MASPSLDLLSPGQQPVGTNLMLSRLVRIAGWTKSLMMHFTRI